MAREFGIELNNEFKQGKTARRLLHLHVVLIVLSLAGLVLDFVQYKMMCGIMEDFNEVSEEKMSFEENPLGGLGGLIHDCLWVLVPLLLFFMARKGIVLNDPTFLQYAYVTEFVGSCCNGCTAVLLVAAFWGAQSTSMAVERLDCSKASDPEVCETTKEASQSALSSIAVVSLVAVLFTCLQFFVCILTASKGTQAHGHLQRRETFTGPAPTAPSLLEVQKALAKRQINEKLPPSSTPPPPSPVGLPIVVQGEVVDADPPTAV